MSEFIIIIIIIIIIILPFLNGSMPTLLHQVPTVAVLGSGGGYRAMTGYTGAAKALEEMNVLDCVAYIAGLSGSAW